MCKQILLLVFLAAIGCKAQTKRSIEKTKTMSTPIVTKDFEQFNASKYNSRKDKSSVTLREFLPNGTYIEMMDDQYWETPPDSYFRLTKAYYPNGYIESKGLYFNVSWGGFQKGTWYYFNEQGKLKDSIDYDKPFKFTFEQLLKLLEKEKILLTKGPVLQSTGYHTQITRTNMENEVLWEVKWLYSNDKIGVMQISGINGKIVDKYLQDYENN